MTARVARLRGRSCSGCWAEGWEIDGVLVVGGGAEVLRRSASALLRISRLLTPFVLCFGAGSPGRLSGEGVSMEGPSVFMSR